MEIRKLPAIISDVKFIIRLAISLLPLAAAVTVVLLPFRCGRSRAEHDHGVRLPESASSVHCYGDAARGFLDRWASTTFLMDPAELDTFVSSLKKETNLNSYACTIDGHWCPPERGTAKLLSRYPCKSPVGDFLVVSVWQLVDSPLGVTLYTDWN